MDKGDKYFNEIVNNGINFINKAISELRDEKVEEKERLKYSTIHLYQGIELLLKSILIREHWSLIILNVDKCNLKDYERGKFYSVRYDTIITRLENCCDIKIDRKTDLAFRELKDLRNKYIHFYCNEYESKPAVINVQYKAWHYIFLLIQKIPKVFNRVVIERLEKIEEEMLKNKQFVDVRFKEIKPILEQKQKEGIRIYTCPFCNKDSIYFDSMEVKWVCLVCNKDYNPYDLAHKIYDLKYHPKHNPDFRIGNCGKCDGIETVVPEESMGGNEGKYLCLNCEREWDKSDSDCCSTCGGFFFGEKLEAGMCHQCWINLINKD